MRLVWTVDKRHGWEVHRARLGSFELAITSGGAGTLGMNVFVGTFSGEVLAIQASFTICERELVSGARVELLRAGRDVGEIAS